MYNNIANLLQDKQSIEAISNYDFKNESSVTEVVNEDASIKKFNSYRILDKKLDCDNSNGSCNLSNDIYKQLWNWSFKDRHSINESLNNKINVSWSRYGTDTMNSFKTIYNIALKLNKDSEIKANNMYLLQRFATLTHSMGNFTLVPFKLNESDDKSFNQYRGFNLGKYFVYDFFDLSLKILKEKISQDSFKKYIDVFHLNMYVDENYSILPLFKRHAKYLKQEILDLSNPDKYLPKSIAELNEYLSNINSKIEERGGIIAAKLIEQNGLSNIKQVKKNDMTKQSKLVRIDKLSIALFLPIITFVSIYYMNEMMDGVGGIKGAYTQFGFVDVTEELIKVLNFNLFKEAFLITVIFRTVIWLIARLMWKCPNCKKKLVFKKLYSREVSSKDISMKVKNEKKDLYGQVTNTWDQYTPGTRHTYEAVHKCKKCGYEKYKYLTEDKKTV